MLYTACVDNGGTRRSAGSEVAVGEGKDQIKAATASDLIKRCLAADKVEKKVPATGAESNG